MPMNSVASQQVAWWDVHCFVERQLTAVEDFPMAGTPAWRELPDDDPRKWAAVLDAGVHHTLRVEVAQTAMAEASQAISASANWSVIARSNLRHARALVSGAYIARARAENREPAH